MRAYKSPTAKCPIAESPAATRRRRAAGDIMPEAPLVMADGGGCRLRVWSEAEWVALPEAEQPAHES